MMFIDFSDDYFFQTVLRVTVRKFSRSIKTVRNVGIIAHIDAGKTTTTERILYNSGKIQFAGEVDSGTTLTDFLDQERQRGISITSATATINWKDHQINLIDTPGHVDFTLEVERSLSVLDGAVTVLDGVKGVEAQTTTVWNQAKTHKIPNIFYINKFDRKTANLNFCMNSIIKKLPNTIPLLIHLPFFNKKTNQFCGIVDVINFNLESWDLANNQGQVILNESSSRQISDTEELFEKCTQARQKLLETLVNLDDGILREEFLKLHNPTVMIPPKLINDAIRKSTISVKASPVIIGSSRMNIGVNNILDKIVSYLPDPTEKEICPRFAALTEFSNHFTALAFKVSHDKFKGPLTFLRIYSGILTPGKSLKNLTRSVEEKVGKIIQITGDQFTEIRNAEAGNIVAISGMRNCFTGDLLVDPKMPQSTDDDKYLDLIAIPTPVIYASIEASGLSEIRHLENALAELSKEDPSLSFHNDEETHQLILGGMGKLHLEIIHDRIVNDYKLPNSRLGKVRIAYKESPIIESNICHDYQIVEKFQGQPLQISVKMSATAYKDFDVKSDVELVNSREFNWSIFDEKVIKLIKETVHKSINVGGSIMRSPIMGIKLILHHIITEPDNKLLFSKSHQALLRSCVMEAARELLKKVPTNLLEPMMKIDISFNNADSSTQLYSANVFGDLNKRRARIVGTYSINNDSHIDHLTAFMPLIETEEYSSVLRTISSGTASLHMSYSHYDIMSQEAQDNVTKKIFYQSKYS